MYSSQETHNNASFDQEVPPNKDSFRTPPFSLFLARTLSGNDFIPESSYCQRHNVIVACFLDSTIKFYDATTLMPIKEKRTQQLDGYVSCMSYNDEIDTFLFGCESGSIYTYHVADDELKLVRTCAKFVQKVAFVNSKFYTIAYLNQKELLIGSLENNLISRVNSGSQVCISLRRLPRKNLLLSGFENGSVRVCRINKPPKLKVIWSFGCHKAGNWVSVIENINVNGKEYMVTASGDCTVKIWSLSKAKMRLVRVIQTEEAVFSLVYLENYKVIAAACGSSNELKFWNVFSGKLKRTFALEENREVWNLFLMRDKNMIGVMVGLKGFEEACDSIEFIKY